MESVTVERTVDADVEDVREAILDIQDFMLSAGFDTVEVDDDWIRVANKVGPKIIELELESFGHPDSILAYRQVKGIFEEMETKYNVKSTASGTRIQAETEFALDVAVVGSFLDSTVIKRQRTHELEAQMDYLEGRVRQ